MTLKFKSLHVNYNSLRTECSNFYISLYYSFALSFLLIHAHSVVALSVTLLIPFQFSNFISFSLSFLPSFQFSSFVFNSFFPSPLYFLFRSHSPSFAASEQRKNERCGMILESEDNNSSDNGENCRQDVTLPFAPHSPVLSLLRSSLSPSLLSSSPSPPSFQDVFMA